MGRVSSSWLRMRLLHILPLLAVAIAQKRSYDGHQVLRVGPLDDESYFVLRDLQMTSNALDFWTEPAPGRTTGIHAREWISPAVATFIVRELVEDYAEHPSYIDNINCYFLPSANPDGYEYSHNQDRYWRKNRAPNSGSSCYGTDLNRNWGFHWAETGVSFDPCSEVYCGSAAFDQPESATIRDFVLPLDPLPVLGHTFHSYSQLWLWPYGYDYGAYPENYKEVQQLAIDASDALFQVHGTVFDPINSADLYPAAGASDDWYKGVLGTRFSFTTELRDTGSHGFILPKDQIIPSGEEMWAGFEVVINRILEAEAATTAAP